jgi:hypothetical protein
VIATLRVLRHKSLLTSDIFLYSIYSPEFDDYYVTSIFGENNTDSKVWGFYVNYQHAPVGGCQQKLKKFDDIIWVFDALNKDEVLGIRYIPDGTVREKKPYTVEVTDLRTGAPVEGATVTVRFEISGQLFDAKTTDKNGKVVFRAPIADTRDTQRLIHKAEKVNSVRSKAQAVWVYGHLHYTPPLELRIK